MIKSQNLPKLSRVHHFENALLLDAWNGIKRRYGTAIEYFSLDERELSELIKANSLDISYENNYFWVLEVISEIKIRLLDGRIVFSSQKMTENGNKSNRDINQRRNNMLMTVEKQEELARIDLVPYIALSTMLICKPRKIAGNQFRHQAQSMMILIDYGLIDAILLKAALVHDHLEDLRGDFNHKLIIDCDQDGQDVYELVLEVSKRSEESKIEFLKRILNEGSDKACLLKAADRIANLSDCQFLMDKMFISRLCDESEQYVLPMAKRVCLDMVAEITDLIFKARQLLPAL